MLTNAFGLAQGLVPLAARALPAALQACNTQWVRWHGNHGHGHHHTKEFKEALEEAPEKFKGEARKRLRDFAKLPWEVSMTPEEAAKVMGSFLGLPNLEPNTVLALDVDQVHAILDATTNKGDKTLEKALFSYADGITTKFFGEEVYYRGIVEYSNVCQNDCGYCGIRKHMHDVKRYTMPVSEVVEVAKWAFENKLGNLMLQAGELRTEARNKYIEEMVRAVREATVRMHMEQKGMDASGPLPAKDQELGLCVSLSAGELPRETYQRWFDAGARRYLLRIESSNPELYAALHPSDMSWQHRVDCLRALREVGYMIGTGIMVGLPGQTLRDLAGDILFFREIGANMIGMGPYITEAGTPVADMWERLYGKEDKKEHMKRMFDLTTRMNSLARITLGNANISATTALQAIDPMGREIALRRGSNVLMPILTPTKYREHYQLYEGKPCITDTADECRKCLNARITMIGKKVKDSVWGDPPNFRNPAVGVTVPHSTTTSAIPSATRNYSSWALPAARHYATAAAPSPSPRAAKPLAAGPAKGSDVPRTNIGVFGCMNAGKR
uniref:Radical SAM core domain-containing protein n=1 Tax=Chlamydomonas leiostraca TaxID=1034604 RepID=A0A6T8S9D1_9CHLO|mmetsp:Transcript_26362/g.67087  ORF Transcript_26362/g.67087 Transcript_26362/m.67087 type:complete len:557 (+) Transcript_26362:198-1868(+)